MDRHYPPIKIPGVPEKEIAMKKQIIAVLSAIALLATVTTASIAASITCSVESIENGQVVLSCGELADKINVGDKVKIRTKTARKAVEGC